MEHRWGIRRTLNVGVTLYVESKFPSFGRLLNASSSGAYLATSVRLPLMARVEVALGRDGSQRNRRRRIAAHVVRTSDGGIGLEWEEFAPSPMIALINSLEVLPAQVRLRASRGAVRRIAQARSHAVYPSWDRSNSTFDSVGSGDRVPR